MRKNLLMKTAMALALSAGLSVNAAEGINFDPDGGAATYGTTFVGSFDWGGANILARNCIPPAQLATDGCTIYIQAKLSALLSPSGSNVAFDSVGHEYTLVVRVTADSGFTNAVIPGFPGSGVQFLDTNQVDALNNSTGAAGADGLPDLFGDATSYFRVYYDDTTNQIDGSISSNELTGTGYNDGTLILSGSVGIKDFAIVVTKALGDGTAGNPFVPLDSSTSINAINASQTGVHTLTTTGSGNFQVNVVPGGDTIDAAFFKDPFNANATLLRIDIDDNGRGSSPFTATEPSPLVGGNAPNYGAAGAGAFPLVNDFDCDTAAKVTCDLHLEGDPKSVFKHTAVPEPTSLALLSLGLGMFGFGARKWARKITVA